MSKISILMVDDKPANLLALETMLDDPEYDLVRATSGEDALRRMLERPFALVLLDVLMPGMDGFETAELIRGRARSHDTPIIFLTAGSGDDAHLQRGYSLGAVDYIYKPIVPEILRAKVQVFAELHRKTARLAASEEELRRQVEELRREQQARRESEEKYRELFARASDAIVVYDRTTGAVVEANKAALRLYGYARREFLKLRSPDLPFEAEPSPRPIVREERRGDGTTFPAEISHGRFLLAGRPVVMALIRDVTERRRAQEAERLREREAMQRQFVSRVSHELRTPIAAIKGFTETLRRGGVSDAKNRLSFLRIIEAHADRLGELVEDLLTMAEMDAGKSVPRPERVPLAAFARRFADGLAPIARRKGVSLKVEIPDDAAPWIDPAHLSRVLQNLLDNAIKYNRKGGSVVVRASQAGRGRVQVSVADTGIGIAPDELPLLFQQFQRADEVRALEIPGTGLGLYMIKALVEANGGRIWAESVKGRGSVFHFTAPLAAARLAPGERETVKA